jgi:predicted dithiol-disulfide oxidoreductase (DUF899 family)
LVPIKGTIEEELVTAARVLGTKSYWGARGAEMTGGSCYFLDLTALGRQENWEEPKGRAASAHAAIPDFSS